MTLSVGRDVKRLRIDPAFGECMVKVLAMTFNGETVPLWKRRMLSANGKVMYGDRKESGRMSPSMVFATQDPNFSVETGKLKQQDENELFVSLEIVRLSSQMAADLTGQR